MKSMQISFGILWVKFGQLYLTFTFPTLASSKHSMNFDYLHFSKIRISDQCSIPSWRSYQHGKPAITS